MGTHMGLKKLLSKTYNLMGESVPIIKKMDATTTDLVELEKKTMVELGKHRKVIETSLHRRQ